MILLMPAEGDTDMLYSAAYVAGLTDLGACVLAAGMVVVLGIRPCLISLHSLTCATSLYLTLTHSTHNYTRTILLLSSITGTFLTVYLANATLFPTLF